MIDHFDLLAPVYEWVLHRPSPRRLKRFLGLPAPGRLLDIGGGTGRVAGALAGLTDTTVVGDLSLPMLRQVRKKTVPTLHPVATQSEALPFPDGTFHRALVVDALHHFIDQRRTLAELARVLRPGGILVVEEPDIDRWIIRGVARTERIFRMRSRFHPPLAIVEMMTEAGFAARVVERDRLRAWILGERP